MNKKIKLISYGTKYNIELKADIYYSCKRFPNPYSEYPNLNGLDNIVKNYVLSKEAIDFVRGIVSYIDRLFNKDKNDKYGVNGDFLTVAFSCYGGKHRSVVIVEELALRLRGKGYEIEVVHRDLDK